MKRAIVWWPILFIVLTCASGAQARRPREPGIPKPIALRIEAYVGEKPPGLVPETTWLVQCLGKEYQLHVARMQVLVGDVSYTNIIEDASPYRLAFMINGPEEMLKQFTAAPPGQRIVLIGYTRLGSRRLTVSQIETVPAPTPTP